MPYEFAVTFLAETEEVVVLAGDLAARPREVEGEGGHVAAQVIDVEDQVFGKILGFAPDHPPDAEGRQAELVPRGVDRLDPGNAEVPLQFGSAEGRQEPAAGAIDMDGDVEPFVPLKFVEGIGDGLDRFVVAGEGDAEGWDDADGVSVATLPPRQNNPISPPSRSHNLAGRPRRNLTHD